MQQSYNTEAQSEMASRMRDDGPENWVDLVIQQATLRHGKIAYTFLKTGEEREAEITFDELAHRCRSIAAELQQRSCAGQRVLLAFPSGIDYIVAFLACLFAGAVAVPAYPPRANRSIFRLSSIVDDARPVLALTSSTIRENLSRSNSGALSQIEWLAMENIDDTGSSANWSKPDLRPGTLAYLQYTSGSTSQPKGVMISHENLIRNSESLSVGFGSSERDTFVTWLPLFHDMGLAGNVLQSLFLGAHCVIMPPESFLAKPVNWLQAITDFKATISGGPNFAYDLCRRKIPDRQKTRLDLSGWQIAFNGSEPVHLETIQRFSSSFRTCGFQQESFYPCYGLAEATVYVTGGRREDPPVFRSVDKRILEQGHFVDSSDSTALSLIGCGHTWLDDELAIVDPVSRTPMPPGSVGEIWVSGPSIADGYWKRDLESEVTFRAMINGDGGKLYLRTGDLGVEVGGELYVTGRIKDLIIIAGRNHFPQDIERTVEACHDMIRSGYSAAVSIEHDTEERLYIIAELERRYKHRGGAAGDRPSFDPKSVSRAIVESVMAEHELPVYGVCLVKPATIPKTSSGKIQRNTCRTAYLDDSLDSVYQWIRQTSTPEEQQGEPVVRTKEEILAWIVQQIVDVTGAVPSDVDIERPFTDYIRNSIDVFSATMTLADWIGGEIPTTLLWANPTIEDIATQLSDPGIAASDRETGEEGKDKQRLVNVVKLKQGGGPILFGLHAAGGMVFFRKMSSYLDEGLSFYAIQGMGLETPEFDKPPFRDIYDLTEHYVDTIVGIQPSGVYHICGIYGVIVLEVGQQLHRRGKEVVLTMVFDNIAPQLPASPNMRSEVIQPVVKLYKRIKKNRKPDNKTTRAEMSGQNRVDGKNKVSFARATNNRLASGYAPEKYPGRIVFVRSEDFSRRESKKGHEESWRAITDELEVHVTSGTHHTMWRDPYARDLAGLIQALVYNATHQRP